MPRKNLTNYWNSVYPALKTWAIQQGFIKITTQSSFRKFFKSYHFITANLIGQSSSAVGFSVEKSKRMAGNKAISELFENLISDELNMNDHPSGVAVSYSKFKADQKAKSELFERDRFFNHYLTSTPFLESDGLDALKRRSAYRHFQAELKVFGIEVSAKEMLPMKNFRFVVVHLFGGNAPLKRFGVILGLGSGRALAMALEHACCEARMLIFGILARKGAPWIPSSQDYWVDNPYFSHHLYARKLEVAEKWRKIFVDPSIRLGDQRSAWTPKVTFTGSFIRVEFKVKKPIELFFSAAHSVEIQIAFWGKKGFNNGAPAKHLVNRRANLRFISEFNETMGFKNRMKIYAPKYPHICS